MFVAPPPAVVEGGDLTVRNGNFRDPISVGRGNDKVSPPSLSVVGLCSDESIPGTYGAG